MDYRIKRAIDNDEQNIIQNSSINMGLNVYPIQFAP